MKKRWIVVPLLALCGSTHAADLYVDFQIYSNSSDNKPRFLGVDLKTLSIDATDTGRFISVNGAFNLEGSTIATPVAGTCVDDAGIILCDISAHLGFRPVLVQLLISPAVTGGLTGSIMLSSMDGPEFTLLETASLRSTKITTTP